MSSVALSLGAVLGLVLLNGFFVAAEFALVAARPSKLAEMAAAGDRLARFAQRAVKELDRSLSATQLGITLSSLGLGWIGEPAIAGGIDALLGKFGIDPSAGATHTVAGIATAFLVITFLHVVYGELAPKSIALVMPERLSGVIALPLMVFSKVMTPFITFLNGTAGASLRLIGIQPVSELTEIHSRQELRSLILQARAHGSLGASDSAMLAGVFDFHAKAARDVMRPRTEIVALPKDASTEEVWTLIRHERYSRYPVYEDSLDNVIGVFVAKDLWLHTGETPFDLAKAVREPIYVPSTRSAERVLDDLRKSRAQMAVVLDEYGGTAGILTMEDLIEEVIGDISDEYDQLTRASVEIEGVLELDASISLVDARSDHQLAVPAGSWATLGGFVFSSLGRLPVLGDKVLIPGAHIEVVAVDGKRVAAVRVLRIKDGGTAGAKGA